MSNYDIFVIQPRQRGGERNWYTVPRAAAPSPLIIKVLPLPRTYVTNLSDAFHEEFMDRIHDYLIPGDKVTFAGEATYHEYYPLDTSYRSSDFTLRAENASSSFNEILYTVDEGVVLEEGYISAMIDCHVKTVITKMAAFRPGNIELSFALPDLIDPRQYGDKSLYGFLMFEPRHARLETEMSFFVKSITKEGN
jgi:hypothetical protein|nr:MAG TPA: hypothetical protein [Caudoviricetes sp.]